jgi:hypothetical protein
MTLKTNSLTLTYMEVAVVKLRQLKNITYNIEVFYK